MKKIILLTVPGCQPIIGMVTNDNDHSINIQHPVMLYNEDSYLVTIPFAPFAKDGMVSFNKDNIISISDVEDEVRDFYINILSELKDNKVTFKKPSDSKKQENIIKAKNLH
jgi:hypothetical protein